MPTHSFLQPSTRSEDGIFRGLAAKHTLATMQLTHYTDNSLRVLIFLGMQHPGKLVTVNDIAGHFGIPRNHLVKVVHRLGQLGYVETIRGKGGGLRLGRAVSDICIGTVVRDMEPSLEIIDCDRPPCPLTGRPFD